MTNTQREREIEAKLKKTVERHGGLCLKWISPGWAGVPDRIILLPGARVMFAETKRPKGGQVSKLQLWWQRKLDALGFVSVFIYTEADVEAVGRWIKEGEAKR